MGDYQVFDKYTLTMQSEMIKFPTIDRGHCFQSTSHTILMDQLPSREVVGHSIDSCTKQQLEMFRLPSRITSTLSSCDESSFETVAGNGAMTIHQ